MEKSYHHLNQLDRDQIALFRSQGLSFSAIGVIIERNGSTVSREYNRNQNEAGDYFPSEANEPSKSRKKETSERVSKCDPYEHRIYAHLCEGWTSSQIAGRLSKDEPGFSVSHETIYCYIYNDHCSWADLLPKLPDRAVIVMDNASFHKRADSLEAIKQAACTLEFSPDLNPIERKWAQAKAIRRQHRCNVDTLFCNYFPYVNL